MRLSRIVHGANQYLDTKGKPLSSSDLVKKCAQEMHLAWQMIASRPAQTAALLAHKGDLKKALEAYK